MKISQRLFLTVMPAIVGLFTVAALAYWGDIGRAAPEWLVAVCAVSTLVSLVLAWQNSRYVARRIARLAPQQAPPAVGGLLSPLRAVRNAALPGVRSGPDELDSIEDIVDRLSNAVTVAEAGSREQAEAAARRVKEYALLLAEASAAVARQLDEVRLPIHILLENRFGQLNENQEEMLEAARHAAEAAAVETGRLRQIADVDRGILQLGHDRIRLGDLLANLRPQLEADARAAGAEVHVELAPGLPRIAGDRLRLQQALELLLRHMVRHAAPGSALAVTAASEGDEVRLLVHGGSHPTLDADLALARRVIAAHGGSLQDLGDGLEVTFPAAGTGVSP
jgi:signal transduction histidine kinase